MTPHDRARVTRALNRVSRCRGCGAWVWTHADYRPCPTCVVLGHRRAIERVLTHG